MEWVLSCVLLLFLSSFVLLSQYRYLFFVLLLEFSLMLCSVGLMLSIAGPEILLVLVVSACILGIYLAFFLKLSRGSSHNSSEL